jgi:hypothetical protein
MKNIKLTRTQNPYNVQAGQKWKSKNIEKKDIFVVAWIEQALNGFMAVCKHGKGMNVYHSMINLSSFYRYVKVNEY